MGMTTATRDLTPGSSWYKAFWAKIESENRVWSGRNGLLEGGDRHERRIELEVGRVCSKIPRQIWRSKDVSDIL